MVVGEISLISRQGVQNLTCSSQRSGGGRIGARGRRLGRVVAPRLMAVTRYLARSILEKEGLIWRVGLRYDLSLLEGHVRGCMRQLATWLS